MGVALALVYFAVAAYFVVRKLRKRAAQQHDPLSGRLLSATEILSISDRDTDESGPASAAIVNFAKSEYGPIHLPAEQPSSGDGYSSLPASLARGAPAELAPSAPLPNNKHDSDSDSDVDEKKHKRRPMMRPVAAVALPPPFVPDHNYDRVPAPAVVPTSLNGSGGSSASEGGGGQNEYDGVRVRKPAVYDIVKVPSSRTVYDQCESSLT